MATSPHVCCPDPLMGVPHAEVLVLHTLFWWLLGLRVKEPSTRTSQARLDEAKEVYGEARGRGPQAGGAQPRLFPVLHLIQAPWRFPWLPSNTAQKPPPRSTAALVSTGPALRTA